MFTRTQQPCHYQGTLKCYGTVAASCRRSEPQSWSCSHTRPLNPVSSESHGGRVSLYHGSPPSVAPSHGGSFPVVFSQVVCLVAHGQVADAWRSRIAPLAGISWQSRFSWDSLVARLANSIKAARTRSPFEEDGRQKRQLCYTGKQILKDQNG